MVDQLYNYIYILFFSLTTLLTYFFCGLFFEKNKKIFESEIYENFFFTTVKGIIYCSFIALLINFFFPLNKFLNTLVLLIIPIAVMRYMPILKKKEILKSILVISIISFLFLLYSNINRPDAALYHLPYISILNEYKIIFGLSNIHFRFGHVSIIQYLSALNNNFIFGVNGINIPIAVVASLFFAFFLSILINLKNKNELDLKFFLYLFISLFIFYKMIRYSGYGNDGITHLFFFLLIIVLLTRNINENLSFIYLLCVFLFMNKNTFVLTLIIPLFFFIKENLFNIAKYSKIIFSFPTILLASWLIKNMIISGCIIYPINFSCFDMLAWTNKDQYTYEALSGEAYAKGWPQNTNKELNMSEFVQNFNWINAWLTLHFKYIIKILVPYILIISFIILFIKKDGKKIFFENRNKVINVALLLLFFNLIFFLKFPLFRYGYSYLISLIVLLSLLSIDRISLKRSKKLANILIIIFPLIFLAKQGNRIISINEYNYINSPWPNIYSLTKDVETKNKVYDEKNLVIYRASRECGYSKAICTNYKIDKKLNIEKKYGYNFINLKN